MTDESRLDRIERIVEANARAIEANARAIEGNTREIAASNQRMEESFRDMVDMLTQFAQQAAEDRAEIRRLVEAMYGDRSNGHGQS